MHIGPAAFTILELPLYYYVYIGKFLRRFFFAQEMFACLIFAAGQVAKIKRTRKKLSHVLFSPPKQLVKNF